MAVAYNKSQSDFTSIAMQTSGTSAADTDLLTGTTGSVYTIAINNTANGSEEEHLKLYDSKAPTVGTTDPVMIIRAYRAKTLIMTSKQGVAFGTALSAAMVTTGGTAGTTNPDSAAEYAIFGS